ncbi:MAG: WG repeat-containing protein [Chloroflexi bacterium]|nr:WG repeat-containing protein [Chloroflexota bacterium]
MNGDHLIGPVKYKRHYGFIDYSGQFVIEPVFEGLGCFNEGLACFKKDVRYGFIDSRGEIAIAPIFESDRGSGPTFVGGLAAVGGYGKVGYINYAGEFVIPATFGLGWDFVDMFALVGAGGEKANYYLIDRKGTVLRQLEVFEIPYLSGYPRSWDLFGCFFKVDTRFLVGFLNWKGEIIFPPKYPWMTDFFEGVAGFSEVQDGYRRAYGLVRLSGEVLRQPSFYEMSNFQEGVARAGRTPKEFGFINLRGEWVIEPKFRQAQPFSEGLACVTVNGKKGFIDIQGEMVIEPRFDREASFHQGFAQVEYEGKRAVIDKSGRVIWETEQDG